MKKTIILNENTFKKIKRMMIREALASKPNPLVFGRRERDDYRGRIHNLEKVANLKVDRYKDHELERLYEEWGKVGFNKLSFEYVAFANRLIHYLDYLKTGIEFVLNDKVIRINDACPHWVFLDPDWADDVIGVKEENERHQSIYCLILKLSQNKAAWNDLFFNPLYANLKNGIVKIRQYVSKQLGKNMNLKLLLPIEQYKELTMFLNDPSSAKPERFVNPDELPEIVNKLRGSAPGESNVAFDDDDY